MMSDVEMPSVLCVGANMPNSRTHTNTVMFWNPQEADGNWATVSSLRSGIYYYRVKHRDANITWKTASQTKGKKGTTWPC